MFATPFIDAISFLIIRTDTASIKLFTTGHLLSFLYI